MAQQQPKIIEKPVDWDELYPGRFIKASDLKGGKVTLRINRVHVEELVGDKGPQMKGIIAFERTEKSLALNKYAGVDRPASIPLASFRWRCFRRRSATWSRCMR